MAERNSKLSPRDRMEWLLACCQDYIGTVSSLPLATPDPDACIVAALVMRFARA